MIKIDLGESRILLYPKVNHVVSESSVFKQGRGETEHEKRCFGYDLMSIKEFREGDNPRLIHRRTTAKSGRLMVREMEDEGIRGAIIEFRHERDGTKLEHQISRLASLFLELLKRGIEVDFKTPARTFSRFETGRSPSAVLIYLVLFELRERAQT